MYTRLNKFFTGEAGKTFLGRLFTDREEAIYEIGSSNILEVSTGNYRVSALVSGDVASRAVKLRLYDVNDPDPESEARVSVSSADFSESDTSGLFPGTPATVSLDDTTPVPLSETSVPCRSLMVVGDPAMAGERVLLGTSGDGNQVVPLAPGQILFLPVSDANQVYVLALNAGDSVIYWPFN